MNDHDGHDWHTRSRHHTSEGLVRYQTCRCGTWRVLCGALDPPAAAVVAWSARRSAPSDRARR
ncbi:hypothetical protein ACFQVD_28610 [Streptosporangium amethystogenes subsp. fukuiense]|uniref:Uncharacterized protein n=1 Tax=Streptosporangium amethystogenes subsp. fukuiense TaxID=698418 RepID=A0ABW2T8D5_9ACTN